MKNNQKNSHLLRTFDDFIQFSHRVRANMIAYVKQEGICYQQLLSLLRSGPLTLKDVHELDDEQHIALMQLLFAYKRHLSQCQEGLEPLFIGTSDEELGLPLTQEISKGWPDDKAKTHLKTPNI